MNNLTGYVATGVISFMVGTLLRHFEPKAKLLYWSPHNFLFELKREGVVLQTNSLTVQNTGRKSAEDIEIIHKEKPDFFQISPTLSHEEGTGSSGEHIIRVKSLGPKEFFMLQLLSYKTVPFLLNIRSKEGSARAIQIQPQRIIPKWLQTLNVGLLFLGLGFAIYWLVKAVIFISRNIGIA